MSNPWFSASLTALFLAALVFVVVQTNNHMRRHGDHRPNLGNAFGLAIKDVFSSYGAIRISQIALAFCVYRVCGGPDPLNFAVRSVVWENRLLPSANETQHSYLIAALILGGFLVGKWLFFTPGPAAAKSGGH